MKIVIEIDEERYSDVKNQVKNGIDNPLKVIIANGIPLSSSEKQNKWVGADVLNHWIGAEVLDKIRSEIEQEYKVESEHPYGQGLRRALEIIDKYRAEGSDKE